MIKLSIAYHTHTFSQKKYNSMGWNKRIQFYGMKKFDKESFSIEAGLWGHVVYKLQD